MKSIWGSMYVNWWCACNFFIFPLLIEVTRNKCRLTLILIFLLNLQQWNPDIMKCQGTGKMKGCVEYGPK